MFLLQLIAGLFFRPAPRATFKRSEDDSIYKNLPREYARTQTGQIVIKHPNGNKEFFTVAQLAWLSRETMITEERRETYRAALRWSHDNP